MLNNNMSIAKEIEQYESNFRGFLIASYKGDNEEFKKDLIKTINEEGAETFLNHYRNRLKNYSADSNEEEIKELKDMILILEGFVY